jgi:type IV pilus assembly protein PilA
VTGEEGDFLPLFFAKLQRHRYKRTYRGICLSGSMSRDHLKIAGPRTGVIVKRHNGFSLIELLIVVAIILVIAAIAIPNLLRSRMAANEASATESMRMINTAEAAYNAAYSNLGYSNALGDLGGAAPCTPTITSACILDNVVASATGAGSGKSGYYFTYAPTAASGGGPTSQYTILGTPTSLGNTGLRQFFTDESYVIRFSTTGVANVNSSPL